MSFEQYVIPAVVSMIVAAATAVITTHLAARNERKKTVFNSLHPKSASSAESFYANLFELHCALMDFFEPLTPGEGQHYMSFELNQASQGARVIASVDNLNSAYVKQRIYLPEDWQACLGEIVHLVKTLKIKTAYCSDTDSDIPDRGNAGRVRDMVEECLEQLANPLRQFLANPNASAPSISMEF